MPVRAEIREHRVIAEPPGQAPGPLDADLSWLNLVRMPAGVVDRFEGLAQVVGQGVGGGDGVRPAWIWMVRQRRAVLTNLRVDQPVWCSIQRLTRQRGGPSEWPG